MGAPCATPVFRLAVASTSQRTLRAPFARTPRRVVRALATPCPGGQDQVMDGRAATWFWGLGIAGAKLDWGVKGRQGRQQACWAGRPRHNGAEVPCPLTIQAEARPAQQEGIPSHTRRHALLTALAAAAAAAAPPADAAQGLSKYLRKRLLDPLSAYVPPVLEARAQLERVAGVLGERECGGRV